MKNGARLHATQWWEQDGEIRYRRAGGVVGIPKDQIERIERDPSGSGARAGASPAAAALAAAAPTSPIEPPSAPAGSPEAWRQRLRTLDASLGRPGVDERGLKKEEAILHTLLGNDAARTGDLDESEAEYRLAVDADPKLSAPLLNLARVRLTQGRNDDAETLIQDALVLRPGDAVGLALLGEVAYRSDRLPEAIDLWERSLKVEGDAGLRDKLQKAKRQLDAEADFFRAGAAHFTLKYDGDRASQDLSREILEHLESQFSELTAKYNIYPASIVIVTLYSRDAFYDVTRSPRWVGGLFDGQIRVPIGGLSHLTNEAKGVFTHELTHCMVYHKTHANSPRWLQEGIAQWQEGKTTGRAAKELAAKFARATPAQLDADFSYPLALSLVEHFLKTYSLSQLLDLLEALGRANDIDAAMRSATGEGYDAFLSSWIRDVAAGGAS